MASKDEMLADAKQALAMGDEELADHILQTLDAMPQAAEAPHWKSALRAAAQIPSFGWSDEIESAVTGQPAADIRSQMDQFSQNYPSANVLANIGGVGLGVATGGLGGRAIGATPGAVMQAARMASPAAKLGAAVGTGAVGGAVGGAGASTEGERISGAATGAIAGGAIGGALPVAGSVLGAVGSKVVMPLARAAISTPERTAQRLFNQELAKSGITPQQLADAIRQRGDEAMAMDLSPYMQSLAFDVRSGIQGGRKIVEDAIVGRKGGEQARIMTAAGQALGAHADDAKAFLDKIASEKVKQAAPYYASAHAQNVRITPEFEQLLSRVPESAYKEARAIAAARGVDVDSLADVEKLDYVKRGLDALINRGFRGSESVSKTLAKEYASVRNQILDYVDKEVPDFKRARGIWAGASEMEDAAALGRDALRQDADELADIVQRYGDAENQAFRYGLAQAIRDKIEGAPATGDATRKLLGSMKNQRIIKAAFGNDEEFSRFMRAAESERTYNATQYEVLSNSKTAERAQRRAERSAEIPDTSKSGMIAALLRHLGPGDPLSNPEVNRILAEKLTQRAPVEAATAGQRIAPKKISAALRLKNKTLALTDMR